MALGLHKAANYYYYPGFHEPGTGLTLGINKRLWQSFDASDRRLIEEAAAAEYTRGVAEFSAKNALWLRTLRDEGSVKILQFDNTVLKAILAASKDVVAQAGEGDELSRKIYASYQQFRALIMRSIRLERETPITSATVFIANRPSVATAAAAAVFLSPQRVRAPP